jgi:fatty-acyl-CoA synthase
MSTPAEICLGDWLARRADRTPHRPALTFEGRTWSFGDLQQDISSLAGVLSHFGIKKGDRVAFLSLNQPELLQAYFACSRLGAILVPLNYRLTGPELAYIINDAQPLVLISDLLHQPVIDGVGDELTISHFIGVDGVTNDTWTLLADLAAGTEPLEEGVALDPDDIAAIMYTSGTTGYPKGAMLSHGNLWWNNVNIERSLDIHADDVTLTVMPIFHIGGLNVFTLIILEKGGHVILHRVFEPAAALAAFAEHQVTTFLAVPTILQALKEDPTFDSTDFSSLRSLVCGGAPSPEAMLRTWAQRGIPVLQAYGLTETSCLVSFLTAEDALERLGSSGKAVMFCDVELRDTEGEIVTEAMARGEVCVRGPNVTSGYWRRPEATAEAIDADGWFRTGDVAYRDAEGFLYIVDRVKDMIISGGENIYPAEVEAVLYEHPAVLEAAVVGMPDDRWGETVVAVLVLRPGKTVELEELREFAGRSLARYKLPNQLQVVSELPKNATGKIRKFELRAGLMADVPS